MKSLCHLLVLSCMMVSGLSHASVELTFFTADVVYNDVHFKWATASESNSMLFQVQRSTDSGQNWFTVASLEGSGTTTTPVLYETLENNPGFGFKMYRLRQVDVSGGSWASEPLSISIDPGPPVGLSLFPNPTSDGITVFTGLPWIGLVSIQNAIGQTIIEEMPMDGYRLTVDISNLPRGIYYVVMEAGDSKTTQKFMKE